MNANAMWRISPKVERTIPGMRRHIRFAFQTAFCLFMLATVLPEIGFSQPSLPQQSPDEAPIDGGLGLLALGGGAYALNKLKKRRLPDSDQ